MQGRVPRNLRRSAGWLIVLALFVPVMPPTTALAQMTAAPTAPALGTGMLPPAQVEKLLPTSVLFKEQSAPLQLRNAAAFRFEDGTILWASLVDTSGYSTGVREKYQFYLVTETPVTMDGQRLPAGAYGAGYLADGKFTVMDVGGHEVLQGTVQTDAELRRPRPLQMTASGNEIRLYLGRQYAVFARK